MWLRKANGRIVESGVFEDNRQFIVGEHDGYQAVGVTCRRRIIFSPSEYRIEVIDSLIMSNRHAVELNFHFHPDVSVNEVQRGRFSAVRSGAAMQLDIRMDPKVDWAAVAGQTEPILGWYSSKLGKKRPTTTIHGQVQASEAFEIRSVFQAIPLDVCS